MGVCVEVMVGDGVVGAGSGVRSGRGDGAGSGVWVGRGDGEGTGVWMGLGVGTGVDEYSGMGTGAESEGRNCVESGEGDTDDAGD